MAWPIPRAALALALACALPAGVAAVASCIATDPPDLPVLPPRRPQIIHTDPPAGVVLGSYGVSSHVAARSGSVLARTLRRSMRAATATIRVAHFMTCSFLRSWDCSTLQAPDFQVRCSSSTRQRKE